jgi:hypothetical protein
MNAPPSVVPVTTTPFGQDQTAHDASSATMPEGESAVLMVRLKQGLAGERQRVCHLVPVSPGPVPKRVVAYCGARFRPGDVEWVQPGRGSGAPCDRCLLLARAAATDPQVAAGAGDDRGDAVGNLTRFLRNLVTVLPDFADKIDAGEVTGARLREFMDVLHEAVALGLLIATGKPCERGDAGV